VIKVTKDELLERYEALGEECDFLAARPLYEQALADAADARAANDYGYLLECHGRRELQRAVELYVRAIELDPAFDKPREHRCAVQQRVPARARGSTGGGDRGVARDHRMERVTRFHGADGVAEAGARTVGPRGAGDRGSLP
jgi:hypothetical protein